MSVEFGANHPQNQNRNQNTAEELKEIGGLTVWHCVFAGFGGIRPNWRLGYAGHGFRRKLVPFDGKRENG